jgi:hypothetical protein
MTTTTTTRMPSPPTTPPPRLKQQVVVDGNGLESSHLLLIQQPQTAPAKLSSQGQHGSHEESQEEHELALERISIEDPNDHDMFLGTLPDYTTQSSQHWPADDSLVAQLQARVESLSEQLALALAKMPSASNSSIFNQKKRRKVPLHPLAPHAITIREVPAERQRASLNATASGRTRLTQQRERLGRNASISTMRVLNASAANELVQQRQQDGDEAVAHEPRADSQHPAFIQRILDMFQSPTTHVDYLNSEVFAKDVGNVCLRVRSILEVCCCARGMTFCASFSCVLCCCVYGRESLASCLCRVPPMSLGIYTATWKIWYVHVPSSRTWLSIRFTYSVEGSSTG